MIGRNSKELKSSDAGKMRRDPTACGRQRPRVISLSLGDVRLWGRQAGKLKLEY
jgi:hypothetical protein